MSVDERLSDVMASVFGVDAARVGATDSSATIPQWDSVGHLELMLAVEAEFGIQFSTDEIASLTNVALIRDRLASQS